ncbi:MAG: hypothetical protein JWM74_117, partial [Myxococcaceae bacterium]|nr:hypothetical protein [Myxococcaceae bacterium]
EFVEESTALFCHRALHGRVREGHGDLRLEHVYFLDDGRIVVIDAIEFDAAYRVGDVCADLAFLAMDLAYHARPDLAEHLLAQYARAANDYDLFELVDFYEAYRACVRAKVAVIGGGGPDARRYYLIAAAAPRRRVVSPSLVLVAGVMASGKTTVAGALAGVLGAPVVDADRTRKHLLGVGAAAPMHEPAWSGAYDPYFTERVYLEVFRRAEVVLRSGRPVIIDASFRSRVLRQRARELAATCGVPFQLVECRAPDDVCRARLGARAGGRGVVSDGRVELFDEFKRSFETIDELSPSEHVVVDTTQPLSETTEDVRRRVPSWPPGLVV